MNKFLPVIGGHDLKLDEFMLMQNSYLEGLKALILKLSPTGNAILKGFTVDTSGVDVIYTSGYVAIEGEIYSIAAGSFPKSVSPSDFLWLQIVETTITPSSPVTYEDTTSNVVHFRRVAVLKYKEITDEDGIFYSELHTPGAVLEGAIIPWTVPAGSLITDYFDNTGKGINAAEGYAICNGLNNTIDLRGVFLAMTTNAFSVASLRANLNGVTNNAGTEGGSNVVTLTQAQIPLYSLALTVNDSGHFHLISGGASNGGSTYLAGSNSTGGNLGYTLAGSSIAPTLWRTGLQTTGITVTGTSGGSGSSHENRPPTYYLYYIMRIK